jgi:hypothetical protein
MSETTKIQFADAKNANLFRTSGKELAALASGKGAAAKAAQAEIARRKANKTVAQAA